MRNHIAKTVGAADETRMTIGIIGLVKFQAASLTP